MFFFHSVFTSYMELSREKKQNLPFLELWRLLLGQLSEDSSLPSEHCGMPSQTSYPAIQSPEPHVNCHTPQPENREEKMFWNIQLASFSELVWSDYVEGRDKRAEYSFTVIPPPKNIKILLFFSYIDRYFSEMLRNKS